MIVIKSGSGRDPDETADIHDLISDVVSDPEPWLDPPNDRLGGKKPKDLIGTDKEVHLRDLARAIKYGMPT
jgi:hypothetical protein